MSATNNFKLVPYDVLQYTLLYLDLLDIIKTTEVDKFFRQFVIENDVFVDKGKVWYI